MSEKNNAVNICMITDDNYIMPTSVAICSMTANKGPEDYVFYIITSNLSEESEKKFKSFERDGVTVNIVREDAEKRFNGLHSFRKDSICVASLSALLKFIIADLFPQLDRILYLDGDLIVEDDLLELYNTPLGDNYAAAVLDISKLYWKSDFNSCVENYFNSGVMLLNLKKMREDRLSEVLIETKRNLADSSLMDQNVFNIVFDKKAVMLPLIYNFQSLGLDRAGSKWGIDDVNAFFGTKYKSKAQLFDDARIIHYASKNKPWKEPDAAHAYRWNHYRTALFGSEEKQTEKYAVSVLIEGCDGADETIKSIREGAKEKAEIILISDENAAKDAPDADQVISGGKNALTEAISKAAGRYVCVLNAGDRMLPGAIDRLCSVCFENSLDAAIFEADRDIEKQRTEPYTQIYAGERLFALMQIKNELPRRRCEFFAKRAFLIRMGVAEPAEQADNERLFVYKLLTRAERVTVLTGAMCDAAERNESASHAQAQIRQALGVLMNEYVLYGERSDFASAVFNHAALLCREYCDAAKTDADAADKDTLLLCSFTAAAAERDALCRYTTKQYRELDFRLNKAYREKSEINEKLQRTYAEKSEKTAEINRLKKENQRLRRYSAYPILRRIKRLFK